MADGGVRSGLDVVRLLALGAKGVLLGRAWAFALAAGGEARVANMLGLIEAEIRVAMALTGVTRDRPRSGQSCGIQSGVSTILSAPLPRASNRR